MKKMLHEQHANPVHDCTGFRRASNSRNHLLLLLHLAVIVVALLAAARSTAQDKAAEVDKIFDWTSPTSPGCVCAVSQNGTVVINKAYGSADLERDVALTPNAVLDAGSLTKQFVAAAALILVEEKLISLSDDVRKYIPELHDYGQKITIDNLLTHTSGIRDWTGIKPLSASNDEVLKIILRQRSLNFNPGEEWSYSNSGFVLMKEIIARVSGNSFSAYTTKKLFEPLGMKSTKYVEDMRDVIPNRALAYDKDGGRWKIAMLMDNERGGGGILTTASDLLIWNEAIAGKKISAFVSEKIQEPAQLNNGRKLSYARGLFLDSTDQGTAFWWHGGSADGYKSVLVRFPSEKISIAIMCNSGDNTDRIGFARKIYTLYAPAKTASGKNKVVPPVVINGADTTIIKIDDKAGLFFNDVTGEPLRIGVSNNSLRIAGGPRMTTVTKDHFKSNGTNIEFMSNDEFDLKFISSDKLELKTKEGKIKSYHRSKPLTLSETDLKTFAGRFVSDEIGAAFRIEVKGKALSLHLEHGPGRTLEFTSVDTDTFQANRMFLRFQRDKSGKVISLEYTNPVLRNVKFVRLNQQNMNTGSVGFN
ncbi:serine hydrolase domain-containing protein [Pollutibacter soli]|uniref:serine hydrolase domain-containing protein n=1 Tax=Pollutibacter soli TaxID=3034157 RepID=UPI0030139418